MPQSSTSAHSNLNNMNQNRSGSRIVNESSSASLNEKLASIGALFGVLNIFLTAFLLYAILTAKSSERHYYVIAAIVNISLLLLLMTCAIIIDKIYLRKYFFHANNNSDYSYYYFDRFDDDFNYAPRRRMAVDNAQRILHTNPVLVLNRCAQNRTQAFSNTNIPILSPSPPPPPKYSDLIPNINSSEHAKQAASINDESKMLVQPPNYFDIFKDNTNNLNHFQSSKSKNDA